jgi:ATP-dependent Clp protease protease subunit
MSNEYETSVQQRLFENRIIYLSGEVKNEYADYVVSRLLTLDSIDHQAEIKLYLSSYGGGVYPGLAIYDAMQIVEAPVATFCLGPAFSMAAWLLAAGEPGRRCATPNSRIMLHQVSGGMMGTSADVRVAAQNMLNNDRLMTELLARHCHRTVEEVTQVIQRDLWMTPEEARDFGVIDSIAEFSPRKRAFAVAGGG